MENFERVPEAPGYDVGRCLGEGGNASVWLVRAESGGGEFALKVFARRTGAGPGDREREEGMRREVRILSALDHDHLVKAHSVVRLRGGEEGPALVLDYAAGGSLAALIAGGGPLGAGETVTVLTPVAQALSYLHSRGFTHGDVSPGNVLFTAQGKPLLADLGTARMVADAGGMEEAGTEGFRDPAPLDAVRGLAPERDVYSLAALGWYCLTGRAPERSADRPPLPLLVPGVPPALLAALEAGLAEDRRQRPTAAELAAAVYHSAPAAPVDLSLSAHPSVIPQLLTRRLPPRSPRERRAGIIRGWWLRQAAASGALADRPARGQGAAGTGRRGGPAGGHRGPRHSRGGPGSPQGRTPARRGIRAAAVSVALLLAGGAVLTAWLSAAGPILPSLPVPGLPVFGLPGPATDSRPDGKGPVADGAANPVADGAAGPGTGVPPDLRALLESPDPEDAVRGLARLRALALHSGDFGLLREVNVPASSAALADAAVTARLSAAGHTLSGFSTILTRVETSPESTPARAVVEIVAAAAAYQERDAAGAVVAEAAAGAEQRMRLVLAPVNGIWRIQDILPAGPSAGSAPGPPAYSPAG